MTVLARAANHTRALPSAGESAGSRLAVTVEGTGVDPRVVALLAEIRSRGDQQLVVVGSVGLVAVDAVLADRRVLPQHRAALLRVARVADVVDRIGVEERSGRRPVGIVAVDARHLALGQRHVRALAELRALLPMALVTRVRDALPRQKAGR